jgi:hypothetical protein
MKSVCRGLGIGAVGAAMIHDRFLTAALSGMVMCAVALLGVILVRIIAETRNPITANITVAVLRGSLQ